MAELCNNCFLEGWYEGGVHRLDGPPARVRQHRQQGGRTPPQGNSTVNRVVGHLLKVTEGLGKEFPCISDAFGS